MCPGGNIGEESCERGDAIFYGETTVVRATARNGMACFLVLKISTYEFYPQAWSWPYEGRWFARSVSNTRVEHERNRVICFTWE